MSYSSSNTKKRRRKMKNGSFMSIVVWLVGLIVLAIVIFYITLEFVKVIDTIAATIVSATVPLLVILLKFSLGLAQSAEEKRIALKHQNYGLIVEKITKYVTSNGAEYKEMASAHLESWVVGSPQVIMKTVDFMKKRDTESLKSLLLQMRNEVGLVNDNLDHTNIEVLTSPPQDGVLKNT